ncbi:MAG: hypothetical protein IPM81_12890 [Saprospirales bacterium]|nr:hypothetical protein [Saprospirales bacterium]
MNDKRAALQQLLKRLAAEYANDPNIQTIGYGLKYSGGKLKMDRVIIFFVRHKYASPREIESVGSTFIPSEIEGFPTDVQVFDVRRAAAGSRDETKYDPLHGGIMSSNAEGHIYWFNSAGTLGILVRDADDGTPMALSNWHVWADGGEAGDDIIQPGHPTAGDHIEAITKVLACGPLVTSLLEWEAPSPLTAGLYGGAAAAAIAAAASDYRDPTRRGQDQTPVNAGERTTGESVEMRIEYPQLPLPGVPFRTNVKWSYERFTTEGVSTFSIDETRVNAQFLLGKLVVTDKPAYNPGERVHLTAAIWDYQPRPCDGYHVVAHLIPHARPKTAFRVVLQPTVCPRTFPQRPPDTGGDQLLCVVFNDWNTGQYLNQGNFDWLRYRNTGTQPVRVVDWFNPYHALQIFHQPLILSHEPASKVIARVAQFTDSPVVLLAYNAAGVLVDQQAAPQVQGVVHELTLKGDGIVQVVVRGGGGEGLLISYCIQPNIAGEFSTKVPDYIVAAVRLEAPAVKVQSSRLKARRCCYTGSIQLPPDEDPGKWNVYLTVQNVNPVPDGTPPDQAATTIGGHLLSVHTSSEVIGCAVFMLLDHAFDVI